MNTSEHQAFLAMLQFNKKMPLAHPLYKYMMTSYLASDKKSTGVFCPSRVVNEANPYLPQSMGVGALHVVDMATITEEQMAQVNASWLIHAFGAWRNTLNIYKIDDDIIKDLLLSSALPDDTPVSIFASLPEWCVYIDLSNADVGIGIRSSGEWAIKGFWAAYDTDLDGNKKLNIIPYIFDMDKIGTVAIPVFFLQVDDGLTIGDNLAVQAKMLMDCGIDGIKANVMAQENQHVLKSLLSCLLWLCVKEPDISNIVGEPEELGGQRYQVHKKTGAFVPPSQPKMFVLGARLGGEIRTYKQRIAEAKESEGNITIHTKKRPHIRRGHWHGYWHGTKQAREFKIRWQPVIFVNG